MPNVHLTKAMQDFAEREVERGAYANVSEVVRAAMRRLMDDDAAAFFALERELERRMEEPTLSADEVWGEVLGNPE